MFRPWDRAARTHGALHVMGSLSLRVVMRSPVYALGNVRQFRVLPPTGSWDQGRIKGRALVSFRNLKIDSIGNGCVTSIDGSSRRTRAPPLRTPLPVPSGSLLSFLVTTYRASVDCVVCRVSSQRALKALREVDYYWTTRSPGRQDHTDHHTSQDEARCGDHARRSAP